MNRQTYDDLVSMVCGLAYGHRYYYENYLGANLGNNFRVEVHGEDLLFLKRVDEHSFTQTEEVTDDMRNEAIIAIIRALKDSLNEALKNIDDHMKNL
jgi:hypothetical protein